MVEGRQGGVSDRDPFLVDTRGYLVLRGVLKPSDVGRLNAHLDLLQPEGISDSDERRERLSWLFALHGDFASLMDQERVLPYLYEFVDDAVRVDHAYGLVW